ncbi:MAG: hypothetical protein JWO73_859 [Candidatus Taylorbacteria bacterium]|nr:hypothetical protein [Candidatus Taylorbacteria bacterium]
MSLIELLVYIALLTTFLTAGIFSAYSMLISVSKDSHAPIVRDDALQSKGFVALFSSIVISISLLLMALSLSENVTAAYESVMHAEYRAIVRARTYACFQRALAKISEDYFYVPAIGGDHVGEFDCTIDLVAAADRAHREVSTSAAYHGIRGKMTASLQLDSQSIQIIQQKFILF